MPYDELKKIADQANMIIDGFAYTQDENMVRVLNLNNPDEACQLSNDGEMLATNMTDEVLNLATAYYLKNRKYMEG